MNDPKISGRALNALSALIHELRPDWHEPGTLDALAKARDAKQCRDGWHLALAAIKASAELTNRTPRVIALEGKHWEERVKEPERPTTTGPEVRPCPTCNRWIFPGEDDHQCREVVRSPAVQARIDEARQVAAEAAGQYERDMAERAEACASERKASR